MDKLYLKEVSLFMQTIRNANQRVGVRARSLNFEKNVQHHSPQNNMNVEKSIQALLKHFGKNLKSEQRNEYERDLNSLFKISSKSKRYPK